MPKIAAQICALRIWLIEPDTPAVWVIRKGVGLLPEAMRKISDEWGPSALSREPIVPCTSRYEYALHGLMFAVLQVLPFVGADHLTRTRAVGVTTGSASWRVKITMKC